MQKIKKQEKIIRNAIRNGDLITIIAVEKALERFSDEDILLGGKKGAIFRSIYYGKPQENWKLSVGGFVGERTLYVRKIKEWLITEEHTVEPLGCGHYKSDVFEYGGGYRAHFEKDGLLPYHPKEWNRHGGEYFKIATGKGWVKRYDRRGNKKKD